MERENANTFPSALIGRYLRENIPDDDDDDVFYLLCASVIV
jgi:hypothetical protein